MQNVGVKSTTTFNICNSLIVGFFLQFRLLVDIFIENNSAEHIYLRKHFLANTRVTKQEKEEIQNKGDADQSRSQRQSLSYTTRSVSSLACQVR